MAAELKIYYTTAARLPELEIDSGQLIFVRDARKIYLDMNGVRISYDSTIILDRDVQRVQIQSPTEGFYFVLETGILWFFKDTWVPINEPVPEILFFGKTEDFPQFGKDNMLYIDNDAIYTWNTDNQTYSMVATKQQWGQLQ